MINCTYSKRAVCLLLLAVVMLGGCSTGKMRTPVGAMDVPEHHYNTGLKMLDRDNLDGAAAEFQLARSQQPDYAPAMAGQALVYALRGDTDTALPLLDDALDIAEDAGPREYWKVLVMEVRVQAALLAGGVISAEDMQDAVADSVEEGAALFPGDPMLYFYAGEAHVLALDFEQAEEMFAQAASGDGEYARRAEQRWQFVQRVNRVSPGTLLGKRIALVKAMTRADIAALLVEEIALEEFFLRTGRHSPQGFEPPEPDAQVAALVASDYAEHPLRADIDVVLEQGVAGLSLYPDGSFRPDEPVTRAEAAFIFENIITRAVGDDALATGFIGQQSRLADVRGDHPAYNAIMLCVTRGVMAADVRSGLFRPLDAVSGVEALWAAKRLRSELDEF